MAMQQNKGIKKTYTVENCQENNSSNIFRTLSIMKIKRIGQFFNSVKRCGVDVSDVLMLLVLMPFYHLGSVPMLVKSGLGADRGAECGNSVFYDLKNNPKVNWRSLLCLVALRFKNLAKGLNADVPKTVRAFIFDDSPLQKNGTKTELASRVHDHVSGHFIFGHKILVMGYWDGLSFYPLDFSLHREKGSKITDIKERLEKTNKKLAVRRRAMKESSELLSEAKAALKSTRKANKGKQTGTAKKQVATAMNKVGRAKVKFKAAETKYVELENKAVGLRSELREAKKKFPDYGLTKKQLAKQFKKYRDADSPGAQRAAETDVKKTLIMMSMLKRAVNRGFEADYVLTDSWFYCSELVKLIAKLNKKHKLNLLSMAKMGTTRYQLTSNGRFYNATELLAKLERKATTARSHKARYIKVPVKHGGIRVNLFFIKIGKCRDWKILATTDLSLTFQKLMDIYQIRWSIELFFRECKQYLNLGKSRSTCFDTQIADATICLLQYSILSFHRRITDYGSFDGIFASALEDAMLHSMASEMNKLFLMVIDFFADFTGIDVVELTRSFFRDDPTSEKIKKLNRIFYENLENLEAA